MRGREIGAIKFDLELSLELDGFVLVIQNSRIMEIQSGDAKGEGSLSLGGVSLWKHDWAPVQFPGHISLGNGIVCSNRLRRSAAAAAE